MTNYDPLLNKKHDYLVKIMLIGDSDVGKSSLLKRFSNDTFEIENMPTIGIDFKIKTVEIDGKKIKLQLLDTAGQERFRSITQSHYRNAMGIFIVFDISNRKSFENIDYWLKHIDKLAPDGIPKIIVGNKMDINERAVSPEEVILLGYPYFETSAKTKYGVNDTFFYLTTKIINSISLDSSNDKNITLDNYKNDKQNKCC